jgi:hypothetical protein
VGRFRSAYAYTGARPSRYTMGPLSDAPLAGGAVEAGERARSRSDAALPHAYRPQHVKYQGCILGVLLHPGVLQARVVGDKIEHQAQATLPLCQTLRNQTPSNPIAARRSRSASGMSSSVAGRRRAHDSSVNQTRVLTLFCHSGKK